MLAFLLFMLGLGIGAVLALAGLGFWVLSLRRQSQDFERRAADVRAREAAFEQREADLRAGRQELDARVISYQELVDENGILKRDLQNIDVTMRKLRLDTESQERRQHEQDERAEALGGSYLKDTVRWIGSSLTPNNYAAAKDRLLTAVRRCREMGCTVSEGDEQRLVEDLKGEYERVVRAAMEREEQARIKARIREEQRLLRELEREREQAERERAAVQAALDRALAEQKDEHSAEVESLRHRLAEAEARAERAVSQAQLTRAGHVYVISNIGSFGEGVFKIGMTRRLEPFDRLRELCGAAVPFPFDVHMMISCDDAPTLENALHRALHKSRLNKVNPRKEFFRSDIDEIRRIVEDHHGTVEYVADAAALEYMQSLSMSEEDAAYIEQVFGDTDEDEVELAAEGT